MGVSTGGFASRVPVFEKQLLEHCSDVQSINSLVISISLNLSKIVFILFYVFQKYHFRISKSYFWRFYSECLLGRWLQFADQCWNIRNAHASFNFCRGLFTLLSAHFVCLCCRFQSLFAKDSLFIWRILLKFTVLCRQWFAFHGTLCDLLPPVSVLKNWTLNFGVL